MQSEDNRGPSNVGNPDADQDPKEINDKAQGDSANLSFSDALEQSLARNEELLKRLAQRP